MAIYTTFVIYYLLRNILFSLYILGNERRKDYGKQKMWGSIGFGIFCISTGYLIDASSEERYEKDYTWIFYLMLVAMIADIMVSITLKKVQKKLLSAIRDKLS